MKLRPWEVAVIGALDYEIAAFLTTGIVQEIAQFLWLFCVGGIVGGLLTEAALYMHRCLETARVRRRIARFDRTINGLIALCNAGLISREYATIMAGKYADLRDHLRIQGRTHATH